MKKKIILIFSLVLCIIIPIHISAEECSWQSEVSLNKDNIKPGRQVHDLGNGNKVITIWNGDKNSPVKTIAYNNVGDTYKSPDGTGKDIPKPTETYGGKDIVGKDIAIGKQHNQSHNPPGVNQYPPAGNYVDNKVIGLSTDPGNAKYTAGVGLDSNKTYAISEGSFMMNDITGSGSFQANLYNAIQTEMGKSNITDISKLSTAQLSAAIDASAGKINSNSNANRILKPHEKAAFIDKIKNSNGKNPYAGNKGSTPVVFAVAGKGECPKPDKDAKENGQTTITCDDFGKSINIGQTTTCTDGTSGTNSMNCASTKTETLLSTSSSSSPNPEIGEMIIGHGACDDKENNGFKFLTYFPKAVSFVERDMIDKDATDNWRLFFNRKRTNPNRWRDIDFSYFVGEKRTYNPFDESVIVTGLPYRDYYTKKIDSWMEPGARINPMLADSIAHVNKAEAINAQISREIGYNRSLNVFRNTPEGRVEIGFLNPYTTKWNSMYSKNKFCDSQYKIKTEPGYDLFTISTYQKWNIYKGTGQTYKCVKTNRCASWSTVCRDYVKMTGCRDVCDEYYTTISSTGHNHYAEQKNGTRTESSPAGQIPPTYTERKEWYYRIGFDNEYHAIARAIPNKTRLTPITPRKDNAGNTILGSIKSGYGFNWKSGSEFITDYDRPNNTFNLLSDVIRPNKDRNIRPNFTNVNSQNTLLFDANVRYNSLTNSPEKSSSRNSTYIRETISSRIIDDTGTSARGVTFDGYNNVTNQYLEIVDTMRNEGRRIYRPVNEGISRPRHIFVDSESDPNRYYHAYWRTRGEANLIPAYRPGPLHFIYLDYPSNTAYTMGNVNTIEFNRNFRASAFNSGSIRVVGNMWEDSFSRPDFRKSRDFYI